MLTYETAKKLKDAGFPQRVGITTMIWKGENWTSAASINEAIDLTTVLVQPTLSELIEECGDDFEALQKRVFKNKSDWVATSHVLYAVGDFPKEAVANLYLALNKS